MARDDRGAVDFVGETGPGAVIEQYLPQPGHYTGRRTIKIEDVPAHYFKDSAQTFGTRWSEYFGLEKREGVWEVARPEALTGRWLDRYGRLRQVRTAELAPLKDRLNASARAALAAQGSLVQWARGGAQSVARLSTAPDAAGNTEGLPLETPDLTPPNSGSGSGAKPVDDAGHDFASAIQGVTTGTISVPTETWGGFYVPTEVDLDVPPSPALFIIQVVGISSFLGNYGLGRTVKTFTLLPGEVTTIHTRTWRATEESVAQASSIIDSYDESSAERFAETVMNETTDTTTQEKTENWHAEAEAKGGFGIASASVSGGGGGEYSSGTEEFARSMGEAVQEHTAEASSHRENTVTSSSESSVSTEDEEVVERTIKNINVSRVLNFTFRELNQEYVTKTHLKDVRIAFTNGNVGSWREEPVSGLRKLVEEFIEPQFVDQVCSDLIATIASVRNDAELPVPVLDEVRLLECGTKLVVRDARPGPQCNYAPPTADGSLYYRFKRGPLGQAPDEANRVDGVVLSNRTVVLATDSVVVEGLLGINTTLDSYSEHLQLEAVREKRLANDREELAQTIVRSVEPEQASVYNQVFGVCCSPADTAGSEEPSV